MISKDILKSLALNQSESMKTKYKGIERKMLSDIIKKKSLKHAFVITGARRSGKSTLLHILGFLDRLTDGLYQFEGKDVSEFTDDQLASLRNKKVGFVFQSYNLLAKTTVLDNVRLPLIYSGRPQKEINELLTISGWNPKVNSKKLNITLNAVGFCSTGAKDPEP